MSMGGEDQQDPPILLPEELSGDYVLSRLGAPITDEVPAQVAGSWVDPLEVVLGCKGGHL